MASPYGASPQPGGVTNYLNELNERIVTGVRLSGEALLSNAFLEGRFMLRACIVNFRTTLKDVAVLPDLVTRIGHELDAKLRPSHLRRSAVGAEELQPMREAAQ